MNIVLIALDTLRADHLGCYGYARQTSPVMDALAKEGILFENSITNTAHTGPTFTTMYTGQYPLTHGVVSTMWGHPNDPDQHLDDTTPTLAECMRRMGYLTVAFDDLMIWPSHHPWWVRGYDHYVHTLNWPDEFCASVLAEQINRRLLPWIETQARQQPFFLFIHYWDPHQPYNQPDPYRAWHSGKPGHPEITAANGRRYIPRWGWKDRIEPKDQEWIDLYDGEINYTDVHVGQILEALKKAGVYDDTTILLTADHGEDMQEHDAPFEHRQPYETTVRVPLIAKPSHDWPAARPARVPAMVGHIDLMPTILELAGLNPPAAAHKAGKGPQEFWRRDLPAVKMPENMDGKSWLPLLSQPDQVFHECLYLTGGAVKQRGRWRAAELAVRTETAKYIRRTRAWNEPTHISTDVNLLSAPQARMRPDFDWRDRVSFFNSLPAEELYDLSKDPDETNNLAAGQPELAGAMRQMLERHVATNPERA